MGGTRLGSWGVRGVWMGGTSWARGVWMGGMALELGVCGVWMLDGWHAAQEVGAGNFGWLARGSGAGGPRSLELGAHGLLARG